MMSRLIPVIFLITITLSACAPAPSRPAQIAPPFPPSGRLDEDTPKLIPVETGWFDGKNIEYYNLGTNTPINPEYPTHVAVAPGYMLVTSVNADGAPTRVKDQNTIFNAEPGQPGYSDLWQMYFTWPTQDYTPNSIRSLKAIEAAGYLIDKSPILVNCPIVPHGSSFVDASRELRVGWINGEEYAYFGFGETSPEPGNLYAFISGFDTNQEPLLVPGQHFIFDATRGSPGYSDFWIVHWVLVDADYKADSIRSSIDLHSKISGQNITPSEIIVNYPHK